MSVILLILLLSFSMLATQLTGAIEVNTGDGSLILGYTERGDVRYTTSDELGTIADSRFYSAIKRKESLSIGGESYIFSPANRFVVVAERTYDMGLPTIVEGDALLIPLLPLLEILAERRGMDVEVDGTEATFVEIAREIAPELTATTPQQEVPLEDIETHQKTETSGESTPTDEEAGESETEISHKTIWFVMIDPGHGGDDPGAISSDKAFEKEIVLDISIKLRDILAKDTLFEVNLTRDDDTFIPLRERTLMANKQRADLFVSIHCNAARNKAARGTQVFFLAPARSDHARATAALENASIFLEEPSESDTLDDLDFIMADIIQNEFLRESSRLAVLIEEAIAEKTGLPARGPAGANFYVLNGSFMPAVLVESAFMSNPDDAALLKLDSFRNKVAQGIADGLRKFIIELPE